MDIAEFLLARVAEDEAVAREAAGPEVFDWRIGDYFGDLRVQDTDSFSEQLLINPTRVLAECEAKRQIAEWHTGVHDCNGVDWEANDMGGEGWIGCPTLRLLAVPYADHPDYRSEWKP